jgi:protein-tyrosine phosphatase
MRVINILVVCSGNICRSPMAAAILRAHLDEFGVNAKVLSAGTMAWEAPATMDAVMVMRERGLDITGHRSRALDVDAIASADLILGMTRDHVGRVVRLVPEAAGRAFLIGEFVRLAARAGPRGMNEELVPWLGEIARSRPHQRVLGRSRDEIADPLGEPLEAYRETAARLDAELREVARLLAD